MTPPKNILYSNSKFHYLTVPYPSWPRYVDNSPLYNDIERIKYDEAVEASLASALEFVEEDYSEIKELIWKRLPLEQQGVKIKIPHLLGYIIDPNVDPVTYGLQQKQKESWEAVLFHTMVNWTPSEGQLFSVELPMAVEIEYYIENERHPDEPGIKVKCSKEIYDDYFKHDAPCGQVVRLRVEAKPTESEGPLKAEPDKGEWTVYPSNNHPESFYLRQRGQSNFIEHHKREYLESIAARLNQTPKLNKSQGLEFCGFQSESFGRDGMTITKTHLKKKRMKCNLQCNGLSIK